MEALPRVTETEGLETARITVKTGHGLDPFVPLKRLTNTIAILCQK